MRSSTKANFRCDSPHWEARYQSLFEETQRKLDALDHLPPGCPRGDLTIQLCADLVIERDEYAIEADYWRRQVAKRRSH